MTQPDPEALLDQVAELLARLAAVEALCERDLLGRLSTEDVRAAARGETGA